MRASALPVNMMRPPSVMKDDKVSLAKITDGDKLDMEQRQRRNNHKLCSKAGGCLNNYPEPDDEPGR